MEATVTDLVASSPAWPGRRATPPPELLPASGRERFSCFSCCGRGGELTSSSLPPQPPSSAPAAAGSITRCLPMPLSSDLKWDTSVSVHPSSAVGDDARSPATAAADQPPPPLPLSVPASRSAFWTASKPPNHGLQ